MIVAACEIARSKGEDWGYAVGIVKNKAAEGEPATSKPKFDLTHFLPWEGCIRDGEPMEQRLQRTADKLGITIEEYLCRVTPKIGDDAIAEIRRRLPSRPSEDSPEVEPSEAQKAKAARRLEETLKPARDAVGAGIALLRPDAEPWDPYDDPTF